VRLASSDEIEQAEIAGGKRMTVAPGFKALTVVRNIAPGFRIRLLLPAWEGQEMDVGEAAAEAIFAAAATPQVREVEAELLRLAREAGGA
jgi:hypothetical protein